MNNYNNPICPNDNFHVIGVGDTFHNLSEIYNVSIEDIAKANPDMDPNNLTVGQIICIPIPQVRECPGDTVPYAVEKGDTLYLIAKKNHIPLSLLIKSNSKVNPSNLTIGEIICIPKHWANYESRLYKISFKYPSEWEKVQDDYYEGPNGYFLISAINSPQPLDELYKEEAYHNLIPYGGNPDVTKLNFHNQDAYLIMPSKEQMRDMDNQAALIAKYPKPIKIRDTEYNYVVIWAEKSYIHIIASSLKFL